MQKKTTLKGTHDFIDMIMKVGRGLSIPEKFLQSSEIPNKPKIIIATNKTHPNCKSWDLISRQYNCEIMRIYSIRNFKLGLLEECNLIGLA
jgi:hypothetical protein